MKKTVQGALAALALTLPLFATAQTAGLTVEQRLQRVEDELAIRRILVDYSATQDARDYPAYAALFAKNGEWVNGASRIQGPGSDPEDAGGSLRPAAAGLRQR